MTSKQEEATAPAPVAITADEAAFHVPPPSYEEVMGVFQTSVKTAQTVSGPAALAYIDIMPRCLSPGNIPGNVAPKFDDFSATIEGANRWLLDNPGLMVWKCETVQRKLGAAKDGTISYDLNNMLRHDATFGFAVFIKGIRLWLTKSMSPGSAPQQLGVRSIVPDTIVIEVPVYYGRRGFVAPVFVNGEMVTEKYETFEGLEDTIKKLPTRLQQNPLPGTVLTVEADSVKVFEGLAKDFDPESTCWSENKNKSQRNTQILRIFYVKGPPSSEVVGYTELIPEVIERPEMAMKPGKFEKFDSVLQRLGSWVQQNKNFRVVNIQQYDAKVSQDFYSGGKLTISTDSGDEYQSTFSNRRMARTLRVFYVTSSSPMSPCSLVTSRLFLPARTGRRSFETMTQTMERIDRWMKVTGASVFSVETLELLLNEHKDAGAECSSSEYTLQSVSGRYWVTAIRVYLTGPFREPEPHELPPLPEFKNGSSSCVII